MIKTILWDFDGVIFDSLHIKGDGFAELFRGFNIKDVQLLQEYHYANGGVSRFDKIKYFYNQILNKEISENNVLKLAEDFSSIIKDKIFDKANLIKDSVSFIQKNFNIYNFHIVSAAEHQELNSICKQVDIHRYFLTINGSPIDKDILVKNIFINYNYIKNETILIGDASTDHYIAKKNGIKFHGYNNVELKKLGNYIETFQGIIL